jgi:hypothetical protein
MIGDFSQNHCKACCFLDWILGKESISTMETVDRSVLEEKNSNGEAQLTKSRKKATQMTTMMMMKQQAQCF